MQYFCYRCPLFAVSFIPHCSILPFSSLVLSDIQTDEAWEPSNTVVLVGHWRTGQRICRFSLHVYISQTQSYQWKYQNQLTFPHYSKHELSTLQRPVLPLSPLIPEGQAGTTWEPTEQENFLRPL
jgi:hypothetical protein